MALSVLFNKTEKDDKTGYLVNRMGYTLLNEIYDHVEKGFFDNSVYPSLGHIRDFI